MGGLRSNPITKEIIFQSSTIFYVLSSSRRLAFALSFYYSHLRIASLKIDTVEYTIVDSWQIQVAARLNRKFNSLTGHLSLRFLL